MTPLLLDPNCTKCLKSLLLVTKKPIGHSAETGCHTHSWQRVPTTHTHTHLDFTQCKLRKLIYKDLTLHN